MLGVIGRNGAGKSTLLKILTRITTPTTGRAVIRGRVGSLLEVGTGFNPRADRARERLPERLDPRHEAPRDPAQARPTSSSSPGIEKFIDTPVKRYSSGMYVRLAFSVAAHLEPEILLVDEVLAVGDAEFQQRCLGRMEDFSGTGRTVAVRLAQHADDQPALRPRDLARRRDDRRGRRPVGRRDALPAQHVVQQRLVHLVARRRDRRPATISRDSCRSARSTRTANTVETVDVREPIGIEIRYRILRAGSGRLREDPGPRPARRHCVQRDGHRSRTRRSRRAGRLHGDRVDSRRTS